MPRPLSALPLLGLACLSCVGTTGGDLFSFEAAASGPVTSAPGRPFTTDRGFEVTLTRAKVAVGAVYLNRALPLSGAQATSCMLPGIYVAEVTQPLVVDALDPAPQPFPGLGEATQDHAVAGEVWLTSGDVNALDDPTVVLDLAGTAKAGGATFPFEAKLTIGKNRQRPVEDPSQPSAAPICKERIVSPIAVDVRPRGGGNLLLRIHPESLFTNVDFSALEKVTDSPPLYRFRDEAASPPDINLYRNLHGRTGVYELVWGPTLGTSQYP